MLVCMGCINVAVLVSLGFQCCCCCCFVFLFLLLLVNVAAVSMALLFIACCPLSGMLSVWMLSFSSLLLSWLLFFGLQYVLLLIQLLCFVESCCCCECDMAVIVAVFVCVCACVCVCVCVVSSLICYESQVVDLSAVDVFLAQMRWLVSSASLSRR